MSEDLSPNFAKNAQNNVEEEEDPRPLIGLVFIPKNGHLMMPVLKRRAKDGSGDVWWDFAGGKRKLSEDVFDCMIREMDEELGIKVEPMAVVDIVPHPKFGLEKARNFILCDYLSGTPYNKLPKEHEEMELCFPEEAIRRLAETGRISDFTREFIRSHVRNQKHEVSSGPEIIRAPA